MPLVIQNGGLLTSSGKLASSTACPCCSANLCCCYSEGSQFLLSQSRSTCPSGTTSTIDFKSNSQTYCTGLSVHIEWNGLSITVDKQNPTAADGRPASVGVLGIQLNVQYVSSVAYNQNALELSQSCGRCVARCGIAISQRSNDRFPPINDVALFAMAYREGCDGDPRVTLYYQSGNSIGPPSVTVTLAP